MISTQKRDVANWLDSMRGAEDPESAGGGTNPRWLPRSRPGATVAVVVLAVMAGFWIWAFSPLAPSGHPDEIYDVTFTLDAEDVCADSLSALERLPGAASATGPRDRARQIVTSTGLLEGMVAELRDRAGEVAGSDADLLAAWLADWDTYLGDRLAYAEVLAGGDDPPFTVTAREGDAVTSYINIFAEVNSMPSCATPPDV